MSDNNKLPVGVNPNFKYAIAKIECVYIGKFVEYQKTHSSPIRNGNAHVFLNSLIKKYKDSYGELVNRMQFNLSIIRRDSSLVKEYKNPKLMYIPTKEKFVSYNEASRKTGYNSSTIHWQCNFWKGTKRSKRLFKLI